MQRTVNQDFEVRPRRQTKLELFLSTVEWVGRRRGKAFGRVGRARLNGVLEEDEQQSGRGPDLFALLEKILSTLRLEWVLLLLFVFADVDVEQQVQSHVQFAEFLLVNGLHLVRLPVESQGSRLRPPQSSRQSTTVLPLHFKTRRVDTQVSLSSFWR